jgi:predicted transcriptional regulator with HTH domain
VLATNGGNPAKFYLSEIRAVVKSSAARVIGEKKGKK